SGASSTSSSPQHLPKLKLTWLRLRAGSSTLDDSPPCRPALSMPPLTGPSARAADASIEFATVAVTPSAAALPRKSRRGRRTCATRWIRNSSSFDIFGFLTSVGSFLVRDSGQKWQEVTRPNATLRGVIALDVWTKPLQGARQAPTAVTDAS